MKNLSQPSKSLIIKMIEDDLDINHLIKIIKDLHEIENSKPEYEFNFFKK